MNSSYSTAVCNWVMKNWNYLVVGALSTLFLVAFFDVSWWAKDEGVFAHLAERVLRGEVIGVDVLDFHGGYHSWLNALLFHWFGLDMLVLRYPLVLLGVVQALLVTYLLSDVSKRVSVVGGIASVAFGFLQFPNPSPNWFALFFAVSVAAILVSKKLSKYHLLSIGVLLGLCLMFRHPSAIFLFFGVATFLVYQSRSTVESFFNRSVSLGFLVAIAASILFYSTLVFEPFAFVLLAIPPVIFIALLLQYRAFVFMQWFHQLLLVGLGSVIAIVPMVLYQLLYGNILVWFHTAFLSGNSIVEKDFFTITTYIDTLSVYVQNALAKGAFALAFVEISYWIIVFAVPLIAFGLLFWRMHRQDVVPAVAVVAPFFGLVSFYFQIPFYFFISFILFVVAIFVQLPKTKTIQQVSFCILLSVTVWGLVSMTYGFQALVQPSKYVESTIDYSSIRLEPSVLEEYEQYILEIQAHTNPGDYIYVFPFDPELYFLSGRENPFPFVGSSFVVNTDDSYERFLLDIQRIVPRMIVFNQKNMYANKFDEQLFALLTTSDEYFLVATINEHFFFLPVSEREIPPNDIKQN